MIHIKKEIFKKKKKKNQICKFEKKKNDSEENYAIIPGSWTSWESFSVLIQLQVVFLFSLTVSKPVILGL